MSNNPLGPTNLALTFDDEFNTFNATPDGSAGWMTAFPYGGDAARTLAGNHEAEYYSDSSVGVNPFSDQGGVLSINATQAAPGSNPNNLPYDSGVITTYKSLAQTYGYFEVRAELPAGQGLWPAFWLLPANNNYTSELDMFEVLGSDPTTLYSTTHGATGGIWSSDSQALHVADTSAGFHTYGVDWEPTTVTYYMDGQAIATAPTPSSMNTPMYMLLNLAVGGAGSWPGTPNSATGFPASFKIDYVRAYATANTRDITGSAALGSAPPPPLPTLVGVAASLPAGTTVGAGQTVTLTLTTNEALGVSGGAPVLTLSDGGIATYDSARSNGNTLVFDAAVTAGQASADLRVTGLVLQGASITDAAGNALAVGALAQMPGSDTGLIVQTAVQTGPVAIGAGPDTVSLAIGEDAYQGDAQFTVAVDGQQVGGTQTASAAHGAGPGQQFLVSGAWGAGLHTVSVDFLNDLYGGSAQADRNLYVTSAAYDGAAATGSLALMSSGTQSLSVGAAAAPVTIGAGSDVLALQVSEDFYEGNAQFTIAVDGALIGGTQTALTVHGAGASQLFSVHGNWGAGPHAVAISFLNDQYGGTAQTDRNLYLDSASYDGTAAPGATLNLMAAGTQTFQTPAPATGLDTITFQVSEDAWHGDAMFAVNVDGTRLPGTETATASHAAGQTQSITLTGHFSTGAHKVAIRLLNGAKTNAQPGPTLYVNAIAIDGQTAAENANLHTAAARWFNLPATPASAASILAAHSAVMSSAVFSPSPAAQASSAAPSAWANPTPSAASFLLADHTAMTLLTSQPASPGF